MSKVPKNGNGTDMAPAMNAARFLLKVENKEGSINKQVTAAREKEAKAAKRTAEGMITACRIPTLCSNQTEDKIKKRKKKGRKKGTTARTDP